MRLLKTSVSVVLICALVGTVAPPAQAGTRYVANAYASTAFTYPSGMHRTCDLKADGMRAGGYMYNYDTRYGNIVFDTNGANNNCPEKFSPTLTIPGDRVLFQAWRQDGEYGPERDHVSAVLEIV